MRQPFLLDTCAALWIMEEAISSEVANALSAAHTGGLKTYVSSITAWEVGTLARKGRFKSKLSPSRWFERLLSAPSMAVADMPPEVLIASSFLPDFDRNDPADRIIAATAREYGLTVVTRDQTLLDYGEKGYLTVLEC